MCYNELSEKELLKACVDGDKAAWDIFVGKYSDLIYHTIHKTHRVYCPNFIYQDLEDLHNRIFLSFIEDDYRKLRQFQGINGCTVSSWIMVITTNTTINFIKRDKTPLSLNEPLDEERSIIDTISANQPSVIDMLEENENTALLKEIIDELKPSDKLFLRYCYGDDLPPEEIAQIMNISVSAVYSKKSRVIDRLKKIVREKDLLQEI